jgi:hypothetical protein
MNEPSSESSWFDIKPLEWRLCAVVLLGGIALHFPAVYYPVGLYIEAVLSVVSFITPISGILWLSAAQVVPDPPAGPIHSSQMAILGAVLMLTIRPERPSLANCKPFLLALGPFFVWQTVMNYLHGKGHQLPLLMIYAGMTGCLAAILAGQSGKRLGACLAAFLAGQALCACVFWIVKLHLGAPVQAFDTALYGDSTEGLRMGTARGNSGMLGSSAALAITGFVGMLMLHPPAGRGGKSYRLLWGLAFLGLCLTAPAMISSGSRGPMVAAVTGLMILGLCAFGNRSFSIGPLGLGLCCMILILVFGWKRFGVEDNWNEIVTRQTTQAENAEHSALVAGRELEWLAAWNSILDSPVFGGGHLVQLSMLNEGNIWESHSTYLDTGMVGGFPGMLLFGWFCIIPVIFLWRSRKVGVLLLLLSVYVTCLVVNSDGSNLQAKHFWILWGIVSVLLATTGRRVIGRKGKANSAGKFARGSQQPAPAQHVAG